MSNKVYGTENFWYDKVCPEKDAGVEKEKGKKMRYGKIRIEDGFFVFNRHMMLNSLPCRDIVWAYMSREGADKTADHQLSGNHNTTSETL